MIDVLRDLNVQEEGEVLWIYLNRPDQMNAFSSDMIKSLVSTLKIAEKREDIRIIVISGEGKAFCAGGDIKDMENKRGMFAGDSKELAQRYREGIQQIPLTIEGMRKPIIAMINGAAIGAGLDLACMCDIRASSTRAKFGETFSKLALVPGDGGSYFLQRVVGFAKAMEMSLTARVYNSSEALEFGLVHSVVEADQLKDKVKEYIEDILLTAPLATQMVKQSIKNSYREELPKVLKELSEMQGKTQRTQDHFEALQAFKEKRKPKWLGK